jgi:ELWxxDGT repeat protein
MKGSASVPRKGPVPAGVVSLRQRRQYGAETQVGSRKTPLPGMRNAWFQSKSKFPPSRYVPPVVPSVRARVEEKPEVTPSRATPFATPRGVMLSQSERQSLLCGHARRGRRGCEGTRRIHRFQPTPDHFRDPELLAAAGGRAFFAAGDGVHGQEVWESDGTPEGTRMVADLAPGGFSSMPQDSSFAVANGFLFFSADDGKTGLEPWALRLAP